MNAADKVINQLLLAMGSLEDLRREHSAENARLSKVHNMTASEHGAIQERIDRLADEIESTQRKISNWQASLGPKGRKAWAAKRGDAYLRARVNARALRATIRSTLVSFKFERRKVERTFRHQLMREHCIVLLVC